MSGYLVVFLGGGLGAALRHGVNRVAFTYLGSGFPYATLFVNVLGGLLMGVLVEVFIVKTGISEENKLFMTTGLLGGWAYVAGRSLHCFRGIRDRISCPVHRRGILWDVGSAGDRLRSIRAHCGWS